MIFLILLLSAAFVGCDLFSTVATTAPEDPRTEVILAEFDLIEESIPSAIIADVTLPAATNPALTVSYAVDGTAIGTTLAYDSPELDKFVTLEVTLTYGDLAISREYEVFVVRDLAAYERYMTNLGLDEIEDLIEAGIPDAIECDLALPVISYDTATVSYATEVSRIYRGRFIFTFPQHDTPITITATIRYKGVTRAVEYVTVMKGFEVLERIPELRIWTDGSQEIVSKDDYVDAVATLTTYDEANVGTNVFTRRGLQIRGRGNSTWWMPKKPYRIKFDDKTAMFTDYEAKDWVLLANFTDQTLIRNYLAYKLAATIGMPYTPSATFVDVFINDEYVGNYTLSDQIEVSPVRVDVEEGSSAVDTGYLIEFDYKVYEDWSAVEGVDYFHAHGYPYSIKSPQPDSVNFNTAQVAYIKDYVDSIYEALSNRRSYTELIDEASFIDWFLVQEVFKNVDSGYSSVYMYKAKGGVLKMGPVWDFDLSSSNPGHLDYENRMPPGWYTSLQYKNIWFYYLMKYDTFRLHLQARWNEIYVEVTEMLASVYPVADSIARSRYLNFIRWDVMGKNWEWYTSPEVYEADTYEEQLEVLYDWLDERIAWMNTTINDPDFV